MQNLRKNSPSLSRTSLWKRTGVGTALALVVLKLLTISETTASSSSSDSSRRQPDANVPETQPSKSPERPNKKGLETTEARKGQAGVSPPGTDELRLCSFNVQRLGHNNGKDYRAVAHIVRTECDGVALLEVMRKGKGAPGFDLLLEELGSLWQGVRTQEPRPLPARGNSEYYAFVWRVDRLKPCQGLGTLEYVPDETGSRAKAGRFSREPAYGCFASATRGTHFDFLVALYHADFDESPEVVQAEVRNIDSAVLDLRRQCPQENDVFVLGDFNLIPKDLAAVTHYELLAPNDGSTLSPTGERSSHQYDNAILISRASTPELQGGAETLDPREEVGSPRYYRERVSDHLPLRLVFKLRAQDDDPECVTPR
jgi:hypothetical protein